MDSIEFGTVATPNGHGANNKLYWSTIVLFGLFILFKCMSDIASQYRNKYNKAKSKKPRGYPIVLGPDGYTRRFTMLREFCRVHNLSPSGFQKMLSGEIKQYKGWRLVSTPYREMNINRNRSLAKRPGGFPGVISPDGELHKIRILNSFCKEHDLSSSNMSLLINGKKDSYKGWVVKH